MITASGLGSGLDIEGLVSQLVAAERQAPELRLNREESRLQATLSGFGQLKSALSSFQSASTALGTSSLYRGMQASSSNSSSVSASVNSSAAAGSYDIEVSQLATRHSLASVGFADRDSTPLGTGSLTIRFGTTSYDSGTDSYTGFSQNSERGTLNLTIDSSNNTLQGISDAINEADAGVRASVVNDGSGYRLLLSSDFTGAENSLEIVVSDDDGNDSDTSGLSRLAFNSAATNLEQTAAAADALFTVNGLSISSAENQVRDTLDGVTLNLAAVTDAPVAVSVERNLGAIEAGVEGFVTRFNELQGTLTALAGYNAASGQGGVLQGDFTVSAVENRIKSLLRNSADSATGSFQRLSEVGITTQSDGTLALDSEQLQSALEDDLDGVISLFAAFGQTSSDQFTVLGNSDATGVGEFAVNITQAATRGVMSGASVLPDFIGANDVTIDADNDSFSISIDGVDLGAITLTQGSYDTGELLAAEIQTRINSAASAQSSSLGVTVAYSSASSSLSITSNSYGSNSSVQITALDTNTAADLGISAGPGADGVDMVGTINGEVATASGLVLTAGAGTSADGLSLEVDAGVTGSLGTVSFGRGIFDQLGDVLDDYLEADGLLDNRSSSLEDRIDRIGDQRIDLERRLEGIEARYRSQFGSLDILLAQLQTTSDFLTQQLASLPGPAGQSDS